MEKKNDFKPFIPADKVLPEFTVTSVILGMILAVIFGGANAFIDGLNKALTKREILKVHILETAMLDTRDTCNYVAERLGAEPVQAIGNKFIIYRKSDEEKYRKIELPRK